MSKHVWAIRVRLEISENHRDLELFNLVIDSKLRGCDLVKLKVADVYASGNFKERASIIQSKTRKPVRFEISEGTSKSLSRWMEEPLMVGSEYLWPGRFHELLQISTRQNARLVRDWVSSIGLDPTSYGTHSMRRTKVAPIYRKTGNLRTVQLLLGHTKMDSTVRYLGVNSKTLWQSLKAWKSNGVGRRHWRPRADFQHAINLCGAASPKKAIRRSCEFWWPMGISKAYANARPSISMVIVTATWGKAPRACSFLTISNA